MDSEIIGSEAQREQAIMQYDYAQMKWILPKQKKAAPMERDYDFAPRRCFDLVGWLSENPDYPRRGLRGPTGYFLPDLWP
jgi:hypothetical protein